MIVVRVLLFPLHVACAVTCVAVILAAAPVLALLDDRRGKAGRL